MTGGTAFKPWRGTALQAGVVANVHATDISIKAATTVVLNASLSSRWRLSVVSWWRGVMCV